MSVNAAISRQTNWHVKLGEKKNYIYTAVNFVCQLKLRKSDKELEFAKVCNTNVAGREKSQYYKC